jgi:hypothetical protein
MHRELAKRSDEGIVVRLFWGTLDDRVFVGYRDERSGDAFTVRVPNSQALAAFHHPNAFRPNAFAAIA